MSTDPNWGPAAPGERHPLIDALRGMSLFGVLMVNLETVFRVPLLEHILKAASGPSQADRIVDLLVAAFLEFKAVTIFSFLFGVGIGIQSERCGSRDVNIRTFLLRRLGWLLVIGTAHLLFVWNGDILALYAVCGFLLLPALSLPWPVVFAIGTAAILVPEFVAFGLPLPSGQGAASLIAQAREAYGHGSYLTIARFRWHETGSLIVPLLIAILPRTVGLMYWGMAAWRSGILRQPEKHKGKLLMSLAVGISFGVTATANHSWATLSGNAPWPVLPEPNFSTPILVALAYASAILLWLKPDRASSFPGFAATGQMALTNYLLQSIVLGFVFYGYGLGLSGQIGSASAACIGLLLYIAQIQISRIWLGCFRFGPLEWLWRSLTYGRRQPMRRDLM